jgi:hypothetical protein
MRIGILATMLAALAACGTSNAGRTLVYAIDGTTDGTVDPSLCAAGVGAEIDLMFEDGLAFAVDTAGQTALLATCGIEGARVDDCVLLPPVTSLDLTGDRITGSSVGRVELADTTCAGADITLTYDMLLEEDVVFFDARAQWQLDPSAACDALEGEIRATDPQGRGVNGCIVQYSFSARQFASCAYQIDTFGNLVSSRDDPCRY